MTITHSDILHDSHRLDTNLNVALRLSRNLEKLEAIIKEIKKCKAEIDKAAEELKRI